MVDYINGLNLEEVHETLSSAVILIDSQLKTYRSIESQDTGTQRMIEKLHTHLGMIRNQLKLIESLQKNTLYCKVYIDTHALIEVLNNQSHPIDKAEMIPIYDDGDDNGSYTDYPLGYYFDIHYSRYAMDSDGFHVGYENILFRTKCIPKKDLGLYGNLPNNLSSYVVDPNSFTIKSFDLPPTELPTKESHSSDCFIHDDLPDDYDWDADPFPNECNCGVSDNWSGYDPPNDDFFHSELDHIITYIIQNNELPIAEYSKDTNEWNIGHEVIWKLGNDPVDNFPK